MYLLNNCRLSVINDLGEEFLGIVGVWGRVFERENVDDVLLGPNCETVALVELDVLLNLIRKRWKRLEKCALEDGEIVHGESHKIRQEVLDYLGSIRSSCRTYARSSHRTPMQAKLQNFLKLITSTINSWSVLDKKILTRVANSPMSDHQCPMYQYCHLYIEVHWFLLSLHCMCEAPSEILERIVRDLVALSHVIYLKYEEKSTLRNPFACSCVKEMWLFLQTFSEAAQIGSHVNRPFWDVFNGAVRDHEEQFSLWLLHNVALLQGYNSYGSFEGSSCERVIKNITLIETKLRSLTAKEYDNPTLLNCCKFVDVLLNEWWSYSGTSEPYMILWEIFNKHIDVSFEHLSIRSASELVDIIERISNAADNSYHYFLYVLNRHLAMQPHQWPKVRGRIYSKLTPNKIRGLTNFGLYNLALLLLSIANQTHLSEITGQLDSFISHLTWENEKTSIVLNIRMTLAVIHTQQDFMADEVYDRLVQMAHEIVKNRSKFFLMRAYVDGLDAILGTSISYSLGQKKLIDGWVPRYLASCQHDDLCYFLNVLSCNVKLIRSTRSWPEWESVLKQHVLPGLKTLATTDSCPIQVGPLAAAIDSNPVSDYVLVFTSDAIVPNIISNYLVAVLENVADNYMMPKSHETAILHAWVRCCLLDCCDNVRDLSRNVAKISAMSTFLDSSNITDDPLAQFIRNINSSIDGPTNARELCEQCFGRLDGWVLPHVAAPTSESSALHVYSSVALLFYHSTPLLYQKNRSSCLLNRLIMTFLLPTNVLMGKEPHPHVLGAVSQTWHFFMRGICRLDYGNDAYLERTLRDMVVRYLPVLPLINSPILKCLDDRRLTAVVFDRIAASFLSHSSRSSDSNVGRALKIVLLALEKSQNAETILKSVLLPTFEVILFHSNKNAAMDVVKYVSFGDKCRRFREFSRGALTTATEKHLAFNSGCYFQFLMLLIKVMPAEVREMMPFVKKKIFDVEGMRGVGYDNTLRQGLDKLEVALKQADHKNSLS